MFHVSVASVPSHPDLSSPGRNTFSDVMGPREMDEGV